MTNIPEDIIVRLFYYKRTNGLILSTAYINVLESIAQSSL